MINWLKERWKYLKLFVSTFFRYLVRDKVDMMLFAVTILVFSMSAYNNFETNVSAFIGLLLVWVSGLIFRLGIAQDIIKELNRNK